MTFSDFNLDADVLDGIHSMGYRQPTPIQEKAIPVVLAGKDLIACAQTGTGKTAAFVLPLLQKILQLPADGINTLILVPTRELAIQIDQQIDALSYYIDVKSLAVYGGGSGNNWIRQKRALVSGADIIIATPGRLLAQMQMGGFDFLKLRHLVLDEADRMLDMGFFDDILKIVSNLPKERQTLCFSATMPPKIRTLAAKILNQPEQISMAIAQPASGIQQRAYSVPEDKKLPLLLELLQQQTYASIIIFSSSKEKVKKLEMRLNKAKISARAFHSDLDQEAREALMQAFKNQKVNVLVGTDILSRGIDVEGIDLVVNFDVPHDGEDYIHRIGRTARADKTGTAITFISEKDQRRFAAIERLVKAKIHLTPLPEHLGSAPAYTPHRHYKKSNPSAKKRKFHKPGKK